MNQKTKKIITFAICFAITIGGCFVHVDTSLRRVIAAEGTPTPEVVVTQSHTFVPYDGSQNLYVVGEVKNETTVSVEFVRITATLYDEAGEAVKSDFSYAKVDQIYPGERSPFLIIFSKTPDWSSYELAVEWKATARQRPLLEVLSSELTFDDFGAAHLEGKVKNPLDETRQFVEVIATLYDAQGEIIGVGSNYADPTTVKPGQVTLFDVRISFWKHKPDMSKVANYRIQAQGSALANAPQTSQAEPIHPTAASVEPGSSAIDQSKVASPPWLRLCLGLLGAGVLGLIGYIVMTRLQRRTGLKHHLEELQKRTSTLLNAGEPLLRGETAKDTVLYQLFKSYGGEEEVGSRNNVLRWLRHSREAMNDAFELRRTLVDSRVQRERSLEQQVHDWEMLYVTLVGNSERILSLTDDELRDLLDPMLTLNNKVIEARLPSQLDDVQRELAGMPLKVDFMDVDTSKVDAEGVLGYIDKIKREIARLRDKTG